MTNVSTRQLQAFVDLADLRNFTRAASRTHLSQPAFSALIRALEEALGARLFDRTTRSVDLTAEGNAFIHAARRLLHDADQAFDDLGDHAARRRGRVSIALLPSLAAGWLPKILATYCAKHPGIAVDVADVLSEACIEQVMTMHADFALAAVRVETPELQAQMFCADNFHLVCRIRHPLARADAALTPRELAAYPFIHLSRTSSVRQYLEAALHPQAMKTMMEVDQLATVMGMVRAGLGISLVPALALFHFKHPEIVTRPVRLPGLTRRIYLVRRRDHSLSIAAQALHDFVLKNRPEG
jgi:LysR family carnitine catabolism transcriptional activator